MSRPYEIRIIIQENDKQLSTIKTKDSFYTEMYTEEGFIKIEFKKFEENNND